MKLASISSSALLLGKYIYELNEEQFFMKQSSISVTEFGRTKVELNDVQLSRKYLPILVNELSLLALKTKPLISLLFTVSAPNATVLTVTVEDADGSNQPVLHNDAEILALLSER
jgi:hypothetical protein